MVAILKPAPSGLAARIPRWRYAWRRLWLHGGWALLSAPLLLAAALLAWRSHVLQSARLALQTPPPQARSTPAAPDLAQQIQAIEKTLPQPASAPQQLRRLLEIAHEQEITLPQAEYRHNRLANSALQRYQITLPLHTSYGKLLQFLQRALEEIPALALDNLQVRRSASDTDEVEARLQLSLIIHPPASNMQRGQP